MIKEENGYFYFNTKVFSYQLDKYKKINIVAIAELLQEVAGTHANFSGFGYNNVIDRNLVWILTAMRYEIDILPVWDQEITVKTWIVDVNRFLSRRHFQIMNKKGEVMISASTIWVLYNFVKRRPQTITDMNFNVIAHPESLSVDKEIKIEKTAVSESINHYYTVQYSDLDMVGHMNNTRYSRNIIDTYSLDFHNNHQLKSFEIQFRNEAVYNDRLEIFRQDNSPLDSFFEIRRVNDNKSICFCKLEWLETDIHE